MECKSYLKRPVWTFLFAIQFFFRLSRGRQPSIAPWRTVLAGVSCVASLHRCEEGFLVSHKIAQRSLWSLHRSATKDDLSLAVFMCLKRTGSRFGNKSHYLENAMLTSYSLCGDAEFWIGCDGGSVEFKGLSFPWRNLPTASVHCLYASGPCFGF